jgi:tetraspanin-13/31
MIILFCLFIVQFAIACSCLAVNKQQQEVFAEHAWDSLSDEGKKEVQESYTCCGFRSNTTVTDDHPACDAILKICCPKGGDDCSCPACLPKLKSTIDSTFKICGEIGLFLSFTEV